MSDYFFTESFLGNTAKDYDLPLHIVESISKKSNDNYTTFYRLLEEYIQESDLS